MDHAALTAILHSDQRARREGFEVIVVRPPPIGGRIFTLSRAGEHLAMVSDAREAGVHDEPEEAPGWEDKAAAPLEFRRLVPGALPTCVRCRSNPAVWKAGQVAGGPVTLTSAQGPICGGCITKPEQIELGEAILAHLREGHPEPEGKIKALEEALAALRDSVRDDRDGMR
jgi:hypothetical protein